MFPWNKVSILDFLSQNREEASFKDQLNSEAVNHQNGSLD